MTLPAKNKSIPQVELVGIYPEKNRKDVIATFHVYLADKDIGIRGGLVYGKKGKPNRFFVQLPQGIGTNDETGKKVMTPSPKGEGF